jgi:fatty-acyl-CoA synthase
MTQKKLNVSDRWIELCRGKTWVDILKETARRTPEVEALVFGNDRINYHQYLEKVCDYAKGLRAIGVKRGDHVGLWMTNRLEWCYARHAIYQLGAIMIPINTRYRLDDLEYILRQSDTKVLIMEPEFLGKINSMSMMRQLCPELANSKIGGLTSKKFPLLRAVVCINGNFEGCFAIDEVLQKGAGVSNSDIEVGLKPDDIIYIIYTSGTTGFPKGIMTPNTINVAYCVISTELFNLKRGDRYLNVLPFFGNIGLWGMSMCLLAGATLSIHNINLLSLCIE